MSPGEFVVSFAWRPRGDFEYTGIRLKSWPVPFDSVSPGRCRGRRLPDAIAADLLGLNEAWALDWFALSARVRISTPYPASVPTPAADARPCWDCRIIICS